MITFISWLITITFPHSLTTYISTSSLHILSSAVLSHMSNAEVSHSTFPSHTHHNTYSYMYLDHFGCSLIGIYKSKPFSPIWVMLRPLWLFLDIFRQVNRLWTISNSWILKFQLKFLSTHYSHLTPWFFGSQVSFFITFWSFVTAYICFFWLSCLLGVHGGPYPTADWSLAPSSVFFWHHWNVYKLYVLCTCWSCSTSPVCSSC